MLKKPAGNTVPLIISLIIVSILIQLPGAKHAFAASTGQVVRENGILGIFPGSMSGRNQVCVGGSYSLRFTINNISPGLEIPIPVVEAMVSVSDGQGNVRELVTNNGGVALIRWPVKSSGVINLTVQARKNTYKPAAPLEIQLKGINCDYGLSIHFQEEVAIIKEAKFVAGAVTSWRGTLKATTGQGEDPIQELSLAGGSGSYKFYVADEIPAPFHFTLDPPVGGDYSIRVRGTDDGNTIMLELGTNPVSYPQFLTMKVTDYSNRGIEVNYKPPVGTGSGNGLFLELNKLNNLTFPASGGVVSISSGMSCYLIYPDRTKYSLVIMLYPLNIQN